MQAKGLELSNIIADKFHKQNNGEAYMAFLDSAKSNPITAIAQVVSDLVNKLYMEGGVKDIPVLIVTIGYLMQHFVEGATEATGINLGGEEQSLIISHIFKRLSEDNQELAQIFQQLKAEMDGQQGAQQNNQAGEIPPEMQAQPSQQSPGIGLLGQ